MRLLSALITTAAFLQLAQPPVFRAQADVVTRLVKIYWKEQKPVTGLTTADFQVTLEKSIKVALDVAEDPKDPGDYVLSFNPPEALRDGKSHRIDVKFKNPEKKWMTLPLKWTAVFTKP